MHALSRFNPSFSVGLIATFPVCLVACIVPASKGICQI
jgi:hypothetical protein